MPLMGIAGFVWAVLAAQEASAPRPAGAPDTLILQDRTQLEGEILDFSADDRFRIRVAGRPRPLELPLEEVARLRFSSGGSRPAQPTGEQVRLADGGVISGRIASFAEDFVVVESFAGPLRIHRRDLKTLIFETPQPPPELRDEPRDLLIYEADPAADPGAKPHECLAEYGRLRSIGPQVVFEAATTPAGEAKERTRERTFERSRVRLISFWREAPPSEAPAGLFSKVALQNGDRWVGVLTGVGPGRVRVFSPLLGTLEIEKSRVFSITFLQQAQLTAGNLLITDQMGLHEFDAKNQEIWTFTQECQSAAVARKLRNGNVLVADRATNSVLEIRPTGRATGEIVGRIEGVENPADVSRLENGNTLVVEQFRNRIAEFDGKTHQVVWHVEAQQPTSAQRLESGNTLICTPNAVYEVKPTGDVDWTAKGVRTGSIRPARAVRLENGNTLITDSQKGQVVEIDADSGEVWRVTGLSHPLDAVRLEDGSTMILERGTSQVTEVDPASRQKVPFIRRGLINPEGISGY